MVQQFTSRLLTRTAGKNSRMQLLQSHAEHHAAQAKLKQETRICSRYSDMSRKLVKLRHRFQLTGYSEDKVTTSLTAEKEYFLPKPASASQQYLELFESIQGISDIETRWNVLRRRFNDGDDISLADMRDFRRSRSFLRSFESGKQTGAHWHGVLEVFATQMWPQTERTTPEDRNDFVEVLLKKREINRKSTSVGTKKSKAIVSKLVQNLPVLENAVARYNSILDDPEFYSLEHKLPHLDINVIKDARDDDEELTGVKSLWHIEATGNVPEWISSERLRDAMVSFVAIQAVEEELKILKREMGRIEERMDCDRGQWSAIFIRRFFYGYQVFDNAVSSCDRIISVPQGTDALLRRASEYLQELRSPRSSGPWENVADEVDMDLGMEDDVDGARRSGLEDPFNDDLNFGSVDSDDDELSDRGCGDSGRRR
ncbi:hypothetical protein V1506DRAFT_523380 [Lipomyces tetrasporus]